MFYWVMRIQKSCSLQLFGHVDVSLCLLSFDYYYCLQFYVMDGICGTGLA